MKRSISSVMFSVLAASAILMVSTSVLSGQTGSLPGSGIPDDVLKILKTSCYSCHGNNGGLMSKSAYNLDKWQEYDAAKKGDKASNICKVLTNGTMPPKKIRESKPELIPTKEQTDLICKWANSLKPAVNKK